MAGIEQVVVHSKSYLVRWIAVDEHNSISWSVQPQKKSINFGIFKHPGTKNGLTPVLPSSETVEDSSQPQPTLGQDDATPARVNGRSSISQTRNDASRVVEKLQSIGLKSVAWNGRCEADQVTMGRYDVAEGEGGTYGMVFDNTFSKQVSKTVTFVLMTHPTNAPPKSGHHLHYSQAFSASSTSVGKGSPLMKAAADSQESLPQDTPSYRTVLEDPRPRSAHAQESKSAEGAAFYTGVLHKKRRRKGQGYARRFFSLDFTSSTLSYYQNRHSSALRGAVPLSLAAVGANEKTREFSIDSGAEVWHLKASNRRDFAGWRDALERASSAAASTSIPVTPGQRLQGSEPSAPINPVEEREWARVEQLVSRVSGSRDAARGLAKDTDPKYLTGAQGIGLGLSTPNDGSNVVSPASFTTATNYFPDEEDKDKERRPFWRRKPSTGNSTERRPSDMYKRRGSAQLAVPSSGLAPGPASPSSGALTVPKRGRAGGASAPAAVPHLNLDENVHERCMALLHDLDRVVADFSALIAESKARRLPLPRTTSSRLSLDSVRSEEFFDADDGIRSPSQLLSIRRSSEFDERDREPDVSEIDADSDTSSDDGNARDDAVLSATPKPGQKSVFPRLAQSLPPLPLPPATRRSTLQPPRQSPPSIIGFLRKNAGKDLSTVAMPVTANEPTSALQRCAETLEYSELLDSAAAASSSTERLMYVAAFAISSLSGNRVKERAVRKPFNPMLGETFELVREDLGFRFLAEKVSHHPMRMACHAESLTNGGWSFGQAPQPVQKFWGKSVELNTEGRAHVVLHSSGTHYSWNQATCFLRNVIAGEKYVEPVQNMTVVCETTGERAVATFKSGGMFSGRSEEVNVHFFDLEHDVEPLPLGLQGKWTESLKRTDNGKSVWTVGPLVQDAARIYGFTTFAASLNEITEIEADHLSPTDSRLRPDQRALENGDADRAEGLKAKLEERQRGRRKVLESHGQQWTPQFFEKIEGVGPGEDEMWRLKDTNGYWDRRAKGDWKGLNEVFEY